MEGLAVLVHAQAAGWPNRALPAAEHFHLLVTPAAVTSALAELMRQMDETRGDVP